MLLAVARLDPPRALAQLAHRHDLADVLVPSRERRLAGLVLERQVLVRVQARRVDDDAVRGVECVDRARRHEQLAVARVELVDRDPLRVEVDCLEPQRVAADAHVDVLGDEDRRRAAVGVTNLECDLEDPLIHRSAVVARVLRRVLRQRDAHRAAVVHLLRMREPAVLAAMLVEQPRDLARVAAELGLVFLERVDLFDHVDRDDHRVVGKRVERACVVKQHVGVQNVVLDGHVETIGLPRVRVKPGGTRTTPGIQPRSQRRHAEV